jgi:hypothetical protein
MTLGERKQPAPGTGFLFRLNSSPLRSVLARAYSVRRELTGG